MTAIGLPIMTFWLPAEQTYTTVERN